MSDPAVFDLSAQPAHPHLIQNYNRQAVRFVRGQGCYLFDDRDRRFLDALSGIAVNALGHAHPGLTEAIRRQAGQLLHTSNMFHIGPQEELAELLCGHCFADRVFFCNSGAEANEAAYKLFRLWGNKVHEGRKTRIISAHGSFHGRTTAALAMTGNPAYHAGFEPLPAVDFVVYGDAEALRAAIGDDVAGVMLEPLQGEGGVVVPPAGYLATARELCDQHQALLAFDEVQVGMGRTGKFFAHQWEGVEPDMMQLAKALGGGVPIGAMLTREDLAALLVPGTHASTFGGNHLACAAGVAVCQALLAPGFLDAVVERGEQLTAGLRRLFPDCVVRGRGLLIGVALERPPQLLQQAALRHGLVVGVAGGQVLRLAPPLVITREEIEELLQRLQVARDELQAAAT